MWEGFNIISEIEHLFSGEGAEHGVRVPAQCCKGGQHSQLPPHGVFDKFNNIQFNFNLIQFNNNLIIINIYSINIILITDFHCHSDLQASVRVGCREHHGRGAQPNCGGVDLAHRRHLLPHELPLQVASDVNFHNTGCLKKLLL